MAGFVEPFRATGSSTSPTDIKDNVRSLRGDDANPVGLFETGADLQLTVPTGSKLGHHYLAANTPRVLEFGDAEIQIPVGKQLAFNWDQATGVLTGMIYMHELPAEDDPR